MYNRLRGRIVEKYGKCYEFEHAMNMTRGRLSKLLTSRTEWTREEIVNASYMLGITSSEIGEFFFPDYTLA